MSYKITEEGNVANSLDGESDMDNWKNQRTNNAIDWGW